MQLPKKGRKDRRGFDYELLDYSTCEGGTIEVIKELNSDLEFICSICSEDCELFPENFTQKKGNISRSRSFTCACNPRYKWSEYQNTIRVERALNKRGHTFGGWDGDYKGSHTRLQAYCEIHNKYYTQTINDLVKRYCNPCKECRGVIRRVKDFSEVKEFLSSKFNIDPSMILEYNPENKTFKHYCPKCTKDFYVKDYNLSKIFYTLRSAKTLNCRCNKYYKYSEEERTAYIKNTYEEEGGDLIFLKWVKGYVNSFSKFEYFCKKHGHKVQRFWDLRSGCRCPDCSKSGFKVNDPAVFYLIKWFGFGEEYIKFGISNSFKSRLQNLKKNAKLDFEVIAKFEFERGESAVLVEKEFKTIFKDFPRVKSSWLPDGYTETLPFSENNLEECYRIVRKFSKKP